MSSPDPAQLREWLGAELARPRLDQAPQQRMRLLDLVAQSWILNGELAKAGEILAGFGPLEGREATAGEALYAERAGDLQEAAERWASGVQSAERSGDRWKEQISHYHLGIIARLRGELDEAERRLGTSVATVEAAGAIPYELWSRAEYAAVLVDLGRVEDAGREAERMRQLYENGEDWGGTGSLVAFAGGIVAGARGELDEAVAQWERALDITREWTQPWLEAEILYRWGQALSLAGDAAAALPHFDSGLEVYRRIGASTPWLPAGAECQAARAGNRPGQH